MISTECAIVIGIVILFQVLDLFQMKSIRSIIEDIIDDIKQLND